MIKPALLLMLSSLVLSSISGCESEALSHEESASEAHGSSSHEEAAASHEEAHGEPHGEEGGHPVHKVIVTSPVIRDVISTQPYVCQIRSCKHIEVRSLDGGYLEEINVNEGQAVRKGDLMFQLLATLYKAKLDTETAEAQRIEIELKNAQSLQNQGIVSPQEIAIRKAELAKAQAQVSLARAELDFASIKAPFDGIVDRQIHQLGSLIEEGEVLTTLSDNSVMWVYFNVPEARYLEYKAELDQADGRTDHLQIELKLANGQIFPEPGKIGAIEADFNNTTGNIAFRADFPNSSGVLRNGQTGTILIHRTLHGALVIPQRATFEILDKRYAYVVDEAGIVHQRDIEIETEQDDIFVLKSGLKEGEKIVFEGVRQVRDGEHIEYEFRDPAEILANQKYHAE